MAKATKPFSGHYDGDDPRWQLTAAGGCTWPTIPAYRYLVHSQDAQGIWDFLNGHGFVIQQSLPVSNHDNMSWIGYGLPFPLTWAWFLREYDRDEDIINWTAQVMTVWCYFPAALEWTEQPGKCNGDVALPNAYCIPGGGAWGETARLRPCQFDQVVPPDWVPP